MAAVHLTGPAVWRATPWRAADVWTRLGVPRAFVRVDGAPAPPRRGHERVDAVAVAAAWLAADPPAPAT